MYIDYSLFYAIALAFLIPMVIYLWISSVSLMSVMNAPTPHELTSGEQRFIKFRQKNGSVVSDGQAFFISLRSSLPGFLLSAVIISFVYVNIHIDPESRRGADGLYLDSNLLLWMEIFLFYVLSSLFHLPFMLWINKFPARACMRFYGKSFFYFWLCMFFYRIPGFLFFHKLA